MDIVISGSVRTAIGSFGGALKGVQVADLGAAVIRSAMQRAGLEPSRVDEVIMGNVLQAGAGMNTARQAAMTATIPEHVPSYVVNKVCGSGLKAVTLAVQAILAGDCELVVAGGMESMSSAPYIARDARWGLRLGHGELVDSLLHDGLTCSLRNSIHMGVTAEHIADRYGISRQEQDEFAWTSQRRAAQANAEGMFRDEIVAIASGNKNPSTFDTDEYIRTDASLEALARLKPAFKKDGTVTAGNASGINDGAAAMVVASATRARELGLSVEAAVRSYASVGVDPLVMGMGPVPAVQKALQRAGLGAADIDLFELNEAFAVQSIAVMRELGLASDRVNVHGGAIALGHPIGASGARILTTLIHELRRRKGRYGVAGLCIGGGQGMAIVVERMS